MIICECRFATWCNEERQRFESKLLELQGLPVQNCIYYKLLKEREQQ